MKSEWLDQRLTYDGAQLRPHWIRRTTGIVGDAILAFRGPCKVREEEMADLVDLLDGPGIAGEDMVHFVSEIFDDGELSRALLRQRLLSATALEQLRALAPGAELRRDGDDLFAGDRKLSISVATRSLVSTLMHFAVNVVPEGTPVPTVGLAELGVDPRAFADGLMSTVCHEDASMRAARCQVRSKEDGGEA